VTTAWAPSLRDMAPVSGDVAASGAHPGDQDVAVQHTGARAERWYPVGRARARRPHGDPGR
jgi:hypothetical protein